MSAQVQRSTLDKLFKISERGNASILSILIFKLKSFNCFIYVLKAK